ncbi:MAG TPA: threonine--tRNA ligase [Candidatus Bathyarchaeia archaeon]|nr:threonine--tRNA ligase [Candidatus Bathyarchaeia archaeon]
MSEIAVQIVGRETVRARAGETVGALLVRLGGGADGALGALIRSGDAPRRAVDLSFPLAADCEIEPVAPHSAEGLEIIRHSTAHLMAQAVKRLHPDAEVTIGPVIEDGFYYDFKYDPGFTPEDLEKIEREMRAIVAADFAVSRKVVPRTEAVEFFASIGEKFKVEIIEGIADESVSLYSQGEFTDLCRGPHVPSTGRLGAFKLTHVAGAYWRGDERNPMLQRIYGTAFADQKSLDEHLALLEEARKRDHRRLGPALDLFSLHAIAPGIPFFHAKGTVLYNTLVAYIRELYGRYGYTEVITPLLYKTEIFKQSGHYDNYRDDMFLLTAADDEYGVKPMNCPGHVYLFAQGKKSYRDLPIRMADFSRLHRFERSGVLSGLTRVRGFAQDDAHIFCAPDQVDQEFAGFLAMTREVYAAFGFADVTVAVETRPAKFLGAPELWDEAEATLQEGLRRAGFEFTVSPGDGAFYGPKIAFNFRDALRRSWTLSTIQIDCAMPDRFGITYVRPDGSEGRPTMLHRAVLGSIERFIAILIEHTGGALPLWLAPVQVKVLSVTDRTAGYAAEVGRRLEARGIRAEVDERNEKLGFKIRAAEVQKVPVIAVVGDKEAAAGQVAPRSRAAGNHPPLDLARFVDEVAAQAGFPRRPAESTDAGSPATGDARAAGSPAGQ